MRITRRVLQFLMVVGVITATAFTTGCDSNEDDGDGDGNPTTGTYTAEITGEGIDESMEGIAFFASAEDPETGEEGFAIWLAENATQTTSNTIWFVTGSTRPGTGSYDIVDLNEGTFDELPTGEFAAMAISGNINVLSTGGTLTLTSSSSTRVGGTFSFTGMGFNTANPEGVEVTVEGSFNAFSTGGITIPF